MTGRYDIIRCRGSSEVDSCEVEAVRWTDVRRMYVRRTDVRRASNMIQEPVSTCSRHACGTQLCGKQ